MRDGRDGDVTFVFPNPGGSSLLVPNSAVMGAAGGKRYLWLSEKHGVKTGTEADNGSPEGEGASDGKVASEAAASELAKVKKVEVEIGKIAADGMIEIVKGISPGDTVVTKGVYRIDEGMTVTLK